MRASLKTLILAAFALSATAPAFPQSVNLPLRNGREPIPDGYLSLQSNISLSIPFDADGKIDPQIEAAQRSLYGLAARQCVIVLETVADDCRISNLNSNVSSQRIQRDNAQILISSQITMIVRLKPQPAANPRR